MSRCSLSFYSLPTLRFSTPFDFTGGPSTMSPKAFNKILKASQPANSVIELQDMASRVGCAGLQVSRIEMDEESCGFWVSIPTIEHPDRRAAFFLFNASKTSTEEELCRTFLWLRACLIFETLSERLDCYYRSLETVDRPIAMPVEWQDYTDQLLKLTLNIYNKPYGAR